MNDLDYLPKDSGDGIKHVVREWNGMSAYVKCAEDMPDYGEKNRKSNVRFHGDRSWGETMNVAKNGYKAARPDVEALTSKIENKVKTYIQPAFESYFDVSGGTVDVGRFLDCEPECMVETRLVNIAKPGKVVTILVNAGMMSSIDTDDFIARGCAIIALVDSLERIQHSTEIWLESTITKDRETPLTSHVLTHLIKIKDAADEIDINGLMFAIAYPGRHRRITFSVRELEPLHNQHGTTRFGPGQGYTRALMMKERVSADVCLESLSTSDLVVVNAEKWIEKVLSEIGLIREEA